MAIGGLEARASFKNQTPPSLVEIGHPRPPVLTTVGLSESGSLPFFSTPFSKGIMEMLDLKKVNMPTINPFDAATKSDDYVDSYMAQMYAQDVDVATCYQYLYATLKGIG